MDSLKDTEAILTELRCLLLKKNSDITIILTDLTRLLNETSRSHELRVELGSDYKIWDEIDLCFIVDSNKDEKDINISYIRLLRGLILLVRNISIGVENGNQEENFSENQRTTMHPLHEKYKKTVSGICIKYAEFANDESKDTKINESLTSLIFSCLSCVHNINCQYFSQLIDIESDFEVITGSSSILQNLKKTQPQNFLLLFKYFETFYSVPSNASQLLIKGHDALNSLIVEISKTVDIQGDLSTDRNTVDGNERELLIELLKMVKSLIYSESFGTFLCTCDNVGEDVTCLTLLTVSQMIPNHTTNKYELTNLVAWLIDYFNLVKKKSFELLNKPLNAFTHENLVELSILHHKLIRSLDIISNLINFDHVREMLNAYDFLNSVIELFKVVEANTEKKKLKDSAKDDPTKKSFPQVKSIIIEIITYLVHNNFKNQETIRKGLCLELILNNCNLDINEPFIRERSILCLKYLLQNNQENQKFIASLEAKGTEINKENEEILENCGYEVDIVDGKVQLKMNEKFQELKTDFEQNR